MICTLSTNRSCTSLSIAFTIVPLDIPSTLDIVVRLGQHSFFSPHSTQGTNKQQFHIYSYEKQIYCLAFDKNSYSTIPPVLSNLCKQINIEFFKRPHILTCLLYTSPSPRD